MLRFWQSQLELVVVVAGVSAAASGGWSRTWCVADVLARFGPWITRQRQQLVLR